MYVSTVVAVAPILSTGSAPSGMVSDQEPSPALVVLGVPAGYTETVAPATGACGSSRVKTFPEMVTSAGPP